MYAKALTKDRWLATHGFNEEGETYLICGNTFEIKDALKEAGFKYDALLKWHSATSFKDNDIFKDYPEVKVSFADLYQWDDTYGREIQHDSAERYVREMCQRAMPAVESEFYDGGIGDRIRNMTAILQDIRGYNSYYGWTNVYTFKTGLVTFIWMTNAYIDADKGDTVDISGTIKKFDTYMGMKQTHLTRCKVAKIEG